jgi:hypothetical protein
VHLHFGMNVCEQIFEKDAKVIFVKLAVDC